MDQSILEPIDSYFGEYRDKHRQLTEQFFDNLVKEAGVSPEENAALMSERAKHVAKLQKADNSLRRFKSLKIFLIVLTVVSILAGIFTCLAYIGDPLQWVGILVVCLCLTLAAGLIAIICLVINKRIKDGSSAVNKHKKNIADIEKQAWRQMAPLNQKYDWNIPDNLIYQTVPQIRLDKYFDEDKLSYFEKRCSLSAYGSKDTSALCVKSGNSDGRPFLLARFLRQSTEVHTYTGTRVVTWTEWETDSKGHMRTVTKSETLIANVVKPKPVYREATYLFYGCDAATELRFDRRPTVPRGADDKKIDNMVKKGEKELEKKTRESVSKGGDYNKLANSEFEVLFGADNRDNELQFRLMFTPLAQQNMVKLLRSHEPYGDDFCFYKNGAVNVIHSEHGAKLSLDANPSIFINYNLEEARKKFIDFNCDYFCSLYFDFAPLFSIPLYTQDAPAKKFDVCNKPGNIGPWEAEAVANYFDVGRLAHPSTASGVILKAVTDVRKDVTVAHITAHSFEAIPQVDYVPVFCRNGHTYEVPVCWTLYSPVERQTDIEMQSHNVSREKFNAENSDNAMFIAGIRAKIKG